MSTFRSLLMIPRQRYHIAASQGRTKQHAIAKGNGDTATTRRQSRRSKQRKAIAIVNRIHPKGIPLTIEVNPTATNIFIGLGSTTSLTCSQIFRFVRRSPVAPKVFRGRGECSCSRRISECAANPDECRHSVLFRDSFCFSGILAVPSSQTGSVVPKGRRPLPKRPTSEGCSKSTCPQISSAETRP